MTRLLTWMSYPTRSPQTCSACFRGPGQGERPNPFFMAVTGSDRITDLAEVSLGRHVFHHCLARGLAFTAFLGTRLHMLVIGELLAHLAAPGTHIGTGRTDGVRERPAPCNDLRAGNRGPADRPFRDRASPLHNSLGHGDSTKRTDKNWFLANSMRGTPPRPRGAGAEN